MATTRVGRIFHTDPVSSLRLPKPITIGQDATVGKALEAVQQNHMGYILVVDLANKPMGIMSERDVLMKIVARDVRFSDSVERFMNSDIHPLTESDQIAAGVKQMLETGNPSIPVVDDQGRAVAVLRTLDIIHFLAEAFPAQVLNLPPRPDQTMEQAEGA